eukprot:s750_g7.t1
MSNLPQFQDPMMNSQGIPMVNTMNQMSPTGFPIPSPVPGGYGTDSFLREQLLADRQQTQWRDTQTQAQLNALLQQNQSLLSHLPFPSPSQASATSIPPASDPQPAPPQPAAPTPPVTPSPAPPPLDPSEVASQILSACKESMRQQTFQVSPAPTPPPSQPSPPTVEPLSTSASHVTPSRPPLPRAHRSTPSLQSTRSPARPRYAEAKRSVPRSRSPPHRRTRSPPRRRTRSQRSRVRHTRHHSPSIPRSPLKLHSRSPRRPLVQLREAIASTQPSNPTSSGWIDYSSTSQWKNYDQYPQSSWSTSWSTNWKDSKWESQSSSWRSDDNSKDPPLEDRQPGTCSPPRTAFSDRRHHTRRRQPSQPRSSPAQKIPPGHVSLVDPTLKDQDWRQTVTKCLNDPTRTKAANEVAIRDRPILADTIDARSKAAFIARMREIDPDIPPTRLQSLIQVLAAFHLLPEVDYTRVEVLILPHTSQRAMVVRLSHIPRFSEKPPFLHQANYSYAMLHGTDLIGAKYCLAEGMVRPANWSYDDNLSKCEQPTYGCFSMGQCVTSRNDDIPNGTLIDLLDRATTKGKGQQEILLALQYKGAKEHLALKAGGNDWAQLQCALKGVVTTSEKYTVARSEHCTIRSLIVVWQDLSFIEGRHGRSATYTPDLSKEPSKDYVDDHQTDRPPDLDSLRSWNRRGGNPYDDDDQ